ncbi:maleylpyruvate isomerase family mycothiol-dependent enzyme [Klenkia terrae]|uniref:Maleylpyruvate isomerase family mycothiol-dependent enzyme n=1 Tax=Klenkia terrae TaxID=1052259 RepID=A0ABU8E076_9ACTN
MTDDVQSRTAANRTALADLCAGLTDAELATPRLCAGWRCRDVLGHLAMALELSFPRFLLEVVRDRGRASRTSFRVARAFGDRPTAELVGILREHSGDVVSPPGIGPLGPFTDSCIHLRDIALPLHRPSTPPLDDWVRALDFLVTPRAVRAGFVARGRLAGLHLVADDGWSWGAGADVTGPAEALALAVSGRPVALADLAGDGVPVLRDRLVRG